MSDLINKDAVSRAGLLKSWEELPPRGRTEFDQVIMTIPALPSIKVEQGWSPVSERLPSKDGCYLVCMSWNYHNMDVLMWADGWNCVRCINGKVDRTSEIDGVDIVAWMPLPDPYKGGDSE